MESICVSLIIGLYGKYLCITNYWFVCEVFVYHKLLVCMESICMSLIIGLYGKYLCITNYWFVCEVFVCH